MNTKNETDGVIVSNENNVKRYQEALSRAEHVERLIANEYGSKPWFGRMFIDFDEYKQEPFIRIGLVQKVSSIRLLQLRGMASRRGIRVAFDEYSEPKPPKKEEKTLVVEIEESRHSETPLLKFSIDGEEIDRAYTTLNVVERLKRVTRIKIEGE